MGDVFETFNVATISFYGGSYKLTFGHDPKFKEFETFRECVSALAEFYRAKEKESISMEKRFKIGEPLDV